MEESALVNKKLIMEAWVFLREKNHSIPNETLDFMRDVSLEQLQNTSSNSDYAKCPVCGESWNMKEHGSCQCGAYIKKRS